MPLLVLNIAWMRAYQGLGKDLPIGKFGYMKDGNTPHEIYNFQPHGSRCFGYAPAKNGSVNIKKLGAPPGATSVDGVTVIWTATHPAGGRFIVGWYDDATVYAEQQERAKTKATAALKGALYIVEAQADDCHLLTLDERVFAVPTMKKGFPGQSAAWFPETNAPKAWVDDVRKYLKSGGKALSAPKGGKPGMSVDPEHRKKVEEAAVRRVTKHYEDLGYGVQSYETDNVGWDLEARCGALLLRLEVKGLSGAEPLVEVTPNEYDKMTSSATRASYRVCIVTNALQAKAAKLRIFGHDSRLDAWVSGDLEVLAVNERVAARLSIAS